MSRVVTANISNKSWLLCSPFCRGLSWFGYGWQWHHSTNAGRNAVLRQFSNKQGLEALRESCPTLQLIWHLTLDYIFTLLMISKPESWVDNGGRKASTIPKQRSPCCCGSSAHKPMGGGGLPSRTYSPFKFNAKAGAHGAVLVPSTSYCRSTCIWQEYNEFEAR